MSKEFANRFKYEVAESFFRGGKFVGSIRYIEYEDSEGNPSEFIYTSPIVPVPFTESGEIDLSAIGNIDDEKSWLNQLFNGIRKEKEKVSKANDNRDMVQSLLDDNLNSLSDPEPVE